MALKTNETILATLNKSLAEYQQIEAELAMLESRKKVVRQTITELVAGIEKANPGGKVPGVTIRDDTKLEFDEVAAEQYVRNPSNSIACAQAFKVKGDKVAVILGIALQHPEFNLQNALSFDKLGYSFLYKSGELLDMPPAQITPGKTCAISIKDIRVGAELAALFEVEEPAPVAAEGTKDKKTRASGKKSQGVSE